MNALEIRNVTKTYPNFTLNHLDLTLPNGCIMGLIGENGAGKSTTIKLILDMIEKDSGTIRIFGADHEQNLSLTKQDLGVVLDEVGFPQCLDAKQMEKILRYTFRNWDGNVYRSLCRTLSVPMEKPFQEFSRGMKMKLGIIAALSHHPKLLLLDEATSGLDPVARDEVLTLLNEFTREENHAILISSHIVSDLEKICDYIAFLHQGTLLLCEEKDRLFEEYGILSCSKETLNALPPDAVKGVQLSPYGAKALVMRKRIPRGMDVSPVSIEELFLFMVKENH